MTPAIIPVESEQYATRRERPGAFVLYSDETPERAVADFQERFRAIVERVYVWKVHTKRGPVTMCGIPCTREVYEGGGKVEL